jgi:membrane-bound lytic murein transglycosylase A
MKNFAPWRVRPSAYEGLFTGYYEIEIKGSRKRTDKFKYPIYARPKDLIDVSLGKFDQRLPRRKIFGKEKNGSLVRYLTRAQIENQDLSNSTDILAWGDNLTDLFFLQIQGSGRLLLPDNQVMQIGYAANNGHPYTAIGRILIKRGLIAKEDLSMQTIRSWLSANPSKVEELFNHNARYIFFRELPEVGVLGALGVKLTPKSSIAIDPNFIPLGAPVWISTSLPDTEEPLQKLMISQDTGAAIKGPVRADIFFGSGSAAADVAGRMKQTGELFIFLPKADFKFKSVSWVDP